MATIIDMDFEAPYPPQGWTEQGTVRDITYDGPVPGYASSHIYFAKRPTQGPFRAVIATFPIYKRHKVRVRMTRVMRVGKWYPFGIVVTKRRTGHKHRGTRAWQRRYYYAR